MKTISPEVAKELAEAARDLRSRINETRGQNATDAVLRMDAALAKFDAEQGKAAEVHDWNSRSGLDAECNLCGTWIGSIAANGPCVPAPSAVRAPAVVAAQGKAAEPVAWGRLGTIDGHLVLVDYQDVRYNHPWLPGAGNDLYNHPLYIHPVPVPSPVRATAVVAAQGVTDAFAVCAKIARDSVTQRDSESVAARCQNIALHIESFAATREQQGGEDARILDWLETKHVEVRDPMRWGSSHMFHASPDEDDEPSNLREQCRAAIAAKEGKGND